MSHLVLLVYLGPTGEKKSHHISVTTLTGTHEGGPAMLRNTMGQNVTVNVMDKKIKKGIS